MTTSVDPVATIDVGTNAMLLYVARREPNGRLLTLVDRSTITGFGRGVALHRQLKRENVETALRVLRDYVEQARAGGASIVRAVGTSALRGAANAADFLEPAEEILGSPVEVISGRREAELTFRGSIEGIELDAPEVTVFDIGGGSMEIVRGTRGQLRQAVSLDIGSVSLFEHHLPDDPPKPQQLAAVREEIRATLESATVQPTSPLVGIAGTVTTVAAILRAIDPYDPDRVHGLRVSGDEVADLAERLAGMTIDQRRKLPGMEAGRADVIVAGTLLLLGIVEHAGASELIVSNGGVRVGLALELTD